MPRVSSRATSDTGSRCQSPDWQYVVGWHPGPQCRAFTDAENAVAKDVVVFYDDAHDLKAWNPATLNPGTDADPGPSGQHSEGCPWVHQLFIGHLGDLSPGHSSVIMPHRSAHRPVAPAVVHLSFTSDQPGHDRRLVRPDASVHVAGRFLSRSEATPRSAVTMAYPVPGVPLVVRPAAVRANPPATKNSPARMVRSRVPLPVEGN